MILSASIRFTASTIINFGISEMCFTIIAYGLRGGFKVFNFRALTPSTAILYYNLLGIKLLLIHTQPAYAPESMLRIFSTCAQIFAIFLAGRRPMVSAVSKTAYSTHIHNHIYFLLSFRLFVFVDHDSWCKFNNTTREIAKKCGRAKMLSNIKERRPLKRFKHFYVVWFKYERIFAGNRNKM